jgi:hypothetical protein
VTVATAGQYESVHREGSALVAAAAAASSLMFSTVGLQERLVMADAWWRSSQPWPGCYGFGIGVL